MKGLLSVLLIIYSYITFSQDKAVTLHFSPQVGGQNMALSTPDSTTVSTFKCYLSHFEFLADNEVIWSEENSFHLLNAEDKSSLELELIIPKNLEYDQLRFALGVDSITSVSGVFGGDLDPTNGMYWTWQSGYIHFKLEGRHTASIDKEKLFEFHLGGYQAPLSSYRAITLPCAVQNDITVALDLSHFLDNVDWMQKPRVMSPSTRSAQLADLLTQCFTTNEK